MYEGSWIICELFVKDLNIQVLQLLATTWIYTRTGERAKAALQTIKTDEKAFQASEELEYKNIIINVTHCQCQY